MYRGGTPHRTRLYDRLCTALSSNLEPQVNLSWLGFGLLSLASGSIFLTTGVFGSAQRNGWELAMWSLKPRTLPELHHLPENPNSTPGRTTRTSAHGFPAGFWARVLATFVESCHYRHCSTACSSGCRCFVKEAFMQHPPQWPASKALT